MEPLDPNKLDIQDALLQLESLTGQKKNELDFLNVLVAHLKGEFAPKFAELDSVKAENVTLKDEKATLVQEKGVLIADNLHLETEKTNLLKQIDDLQKP